MLYEKERERLSLIVKTMYDRFGTNAAGGNVSVRMNESHIIMTPTLMSQDYLCNLSPFQILVVDMEENILEGHGNLTREINMHMACFKTHSKIGAVVHGHAKESMVFATMGIDMPNLTEATQKFGQISCLPFYPATSKELAEEVRKHVEDLGDDVTAKAILLNSHGVLVLDKTINKAYDSLERLEYNAYVAYKSIVAEKLGVVDIGTRSYQYNLDE